MCFTRARCDVVVVFKGLECPFFSDMMRAGFRGAASMSPQDPLDGIELELIERELYALSEIEQAAQHRSLALPVGYEKSQALAEHWNAAAALGAVSRRRGRLLAWPCRHGR